MRTLQRVGASLLVLTLAGGIAACGSDDDTADDTADTTTTEEASESETVEVTAVDYEFEGVPDTVAAGTTLTLTNTSTAELHEMVIFQAPEDEDRSLEELLALPESELDAIFGGGPPAAVLLAPPGGGETIQAVGDGTLTEPGRYYMICAIPTGADPDEYLNAPPTDGPPDVAGGPPHFTEGMFAEFSVE